MTTWKKCRKRFHIVDFREAVPGETLESHGAQLAVKDTDLILRDVEGGLYPVSREVFDRTYDVLDEHEEKADLVRILEDIMADGREDVSVGAIIVVEGDTVHVVAVPREGPQRAFTFDSTLATQVIDGKNVDERRHRQFAGDIPRALRWLVTGKDEDRP